ncbi:MAG: hypothetical protein A3C30_03620 [Candidatus Levybacteria bacterium RIFCSPHIGHO2_02_FULL_40_18]|nr:MAG: hypothetical protein A2869_00195 [Candidatus Levybacteria bacterium RIFCSPHIGHO2_01_FULL_40_58]OGH26174.1 MAG: hypothetical protein A3C30_03620 [Candidatus Levybacteria bacterium RIFCSPHIGHO2_02_FULL_40_18]OGH31372.1 MAG: hypothetical protein A3E43_03300 [Candidatus Levybacteria bacterium RIFCSPHIGHO2_12_FULL_40_31]OGH40057.1 MAG: hypothetical protein A2894_03935 [Candidatus Levybacteria bacterium RIFCSPLOWO2_01_FULL_40_64]OGH49021.1 MAG: hypothetical protein A3I54_00400 [Candidatus Lev
MELIKIGGFLIAAAIIFAWLNVWGVPRRRADVATEVSIKIVFLGFAGAIGVLLILIGAASLII